MALEAAETAHPELLADLAARSPQEPYRDLPLYLARGGSRRPGCATRTWPTAAPRSSSPICGWCSESLTAAGAIRQAFGELQHLIWQAETFGFHLAGLEIRQHSAVHARALREMPRRGTLSAQTNEVLATFRAAGWIQDRFGVDACRRYVVSFTRSAADIAAVYELARRAIRSGRRRCSTWSRCSRAARTCTTPPRCWTTCWRSSRWRQRLAANGRQVEVMLGYSDSAKELGPVSATLRLFDAQDRLARWAADHDGR